jgi:hypothetical protein
MAQKTQNQELFYLWLLEWETQHPQYNPSVEKRLQDFRQIMEQTDQDVLTLEVMKQNKKQYMVQNQPNSSSMFDDWFRFLVF